MWWDHTEMFYPQSPSPTTTGQTSTHASPRSASVPATSSTTVREYIRLRTALPIADLTPSHSDYENSNDGINTRDGAQLLVENNVFSGVADPIYSTDAGYVTARGNDLGGGANTAPAGSISSVPYKYTLLATSAVKASVLANAGATLSF
jgi:hypothetical protein